MRELAGDACARIIFAGATHTELTIPDKQKKITKITLLENRISAIIKTRNKSWILIHGNRELPLFAITGFEWRPQK